MEVFTTYSTNLGSKKENPLRETVMGSRSIKKEIK